MIKQFDSFYLRQFLDTLRQELNVSSLVMNDPVQFIHRFKDKKDIEIAGFFASHLAFGRVQMIIKNLQKLFNIMQWMPYEFIMNFNKKEECIFSDYVYRFIKGSDISRVIYCLKEIYAEHYGLEEFFLKGYSIMDSNLLMTIQKFVKNFYSLKALKDTMKKANTLADNSGFYFLLPPPGSKSAYKRLNLFLRWMVRREKGLDTGLWDKINASQLIIPLDTHIARISKNITLTKRKTPDIKMAVEITENLKLLDRDDPLKYDFLLCHLGISEGCRGEYASDVCPGCKIGEICMFIR